MVNQLNYVPLNSSNYVPLNSSWYDPVKGLPSPPIAVSTIVPPVHVYMVGFVVESYIMYRIQVDEESRPVPVYVPGVAPAGTKPSCTEELFITINELLKSILVTVSANKVGSGV